MRFRNRDHVSVNPKVWTAPNGRRIEWRSDKQTFDAFLASLQEYYTANNLGHIDPLAVEHTFCKQMPKWVCSEQDFRGNAESSPVVTSGRSVGCRSCGRSK